MSKMPYIKLFADTSEAVEMLSDAEAGRLLKSLLRYANDEELIISGNERFVFGMLKAQIDRDTAGYQDYLDKQRVNGSKGGRPKKPTETQQNPENPSLFKKTQKTQNKDKDEDKDEDEDEDKDKKSADALRADRFEQFWAAYPRHTGKKAAQQAFKRLDPDEDLLQSMLKAIAAWSKSQQWTKDGGQFIPHPATWLNGRRWEDELPPAQQAAGKAGKAVNAQQYTQRQYTEKELNWATEQLLREAMDEEE